MTDEERRFLEMLHTTPREELEAKLARLGLLESFKEVERET